MSAHGATEETALHLQRVLTFLLLLPLAQHRAPVCNESSMFHVNHFPVESIINNTDSSKGRNPCHLAARTVNENVIKEVNLRAMK